jgi:hypothetical protein
LLERCDQPQGPDQAAAPKRREPDAKVTAMLSCVAAYPGMRGAATAAFGDSCRRRGHVVSLTDPLAAGKDDAVQQRVIDSQTGNMEHAEFVAPFSRS